MTAESSPGSPRWFATALEAAGDYPDRGQIADEAGNISLTDGKWSSGPDTVADLFLAAELSANEVSDERLALIGLTHLNVLLERHGLTLDTVTVRPAVPAGGGQNG